MYMYSLGDFLAIQLLFYWSGRTKRKWNWKWKRKWKQGNRNIHTLTTVCRPRVPNNINNVNNRGKNAFDSIDPSAVCVAIDFDFVCSPRVFYSLRNLFFICIFVSLTHDVDLFVYKARRWKEMNEHANKSYILHNSTAYFIAVFQCASILRKCCVHGVQWAALRSNILFLFELIRMLYIRAHYLT